MTVKKLFNTHLNQHVAFGRKRPGPQNRKLPLSKYVRKNLPTPPATFDFTAKATLPMRQTYKNTQLGCCVISGLLHQIGLWTANAGGPPAIFTDATVVSLYSQIGGYQPGNPATDNGCDEQTALQTWMRGQRELAGHAIQGYLALDATNPAAYKAAHYAFESLYFGAEVADAYTQVGDDFVWDYLPPNPEDGHCVIAGGADPEGLTVWTWGMKGRWLDRAITRMVTPQHGGELYVLISQESINRASQKTASEIDWPSLVNDFNALGGHLVVPVPPPPTPPPAPVPVPAPSPLPPFVKQAIDGLFAEIEALVKNHVLAVNLLKELNAWIDLHLGIQQSFWAPGFQFPKEDAAPFLRNLFGMTLNDLERVHPDLAPQIGLARVRVIDRCAKL